MKRFQKIYYYSQKIEQADAADNFEEMCSWMKKLADNTVPEYARGAINSDFINIHNLDMNVLAVVIAGYRKVMIWWDFKRLTPNMIKLLSHYGLNYVKLFDINKIVIYSDEGKANAKESIDYFSQKEDRLESDKHHRFVGRCLGYPKEDIEYFVNFGSREFFKKDKLVEIE